MDPAIVTKTATATAATTPLLIRPRRGIGETYPLAAGRKEFGCGHLQTGRVQACRLRRTTAPATTTATPPSAKRTEGMVPGDLDAATAEAGVCSRVELTVVVLLRAVAELARTVVELL